MAGQQSAKFLSLLCALSIIYSLFSFCTFYYSKIYQHSQSLSSGSKKLSTNTTYAIEQDTIPRLFPIKDILLETTEYFSFRLSSTSMTEISVDFGELDSTELIVEVSRVVSYGSPVFERTR